MTDVDLHTESDYIPEQLNWGRYINRTYSERNPKVPRIVHLPYPGDEITTCTHVYASDGMQSLRHSPFLLRTLHNV